MGDKYDKKACELAVQFGYADFVFMADELRAAAVEAQKEERAAIVWWLRNCGNEYGSTYSRADEIERGDHIPEEKTR